MATKQKQNGTAQETAVQEIDIETAQMVIKAAKEKKVQEYLKEYEALCKKYGLQIVPNVQMGVREL